MKNVLMRLDQWLFSPPHPFEEVVKLTASFFEPATHEAPAKEPAAPLPSQSQVDAPMPPDAQHS